MFTMKIFVITLGLAFRHPNLLMRSYVAIPLHEAQEAMYPSILLVKPPFADMPISVRFRPLNGI